MLPSNGLRDAASSNSVAFQGAGGVCSAIAAAKRAWASALKCESQPTLNW
jgi:hypothetical protein